MTAILYERKVYCSKGIKMSIKMKDVIEIVVMTLFLVFAYGVASYYDTKVYNEIYNATATTENTTEYYYGE